MRESEFQHGRGPRVRIQNMRWLVSSLLMLSIPLFGGGCIDDRFDDNICGDGVIAEGEECDDGNRVDDDACANDCFENVAYCGNGIIDGAEECDDGNDVDGDGCSSTCIEEIDDCGNGIIDDGEDCDGGPYCSDECAWGPDVEFTVNGRVINTLGGPVGGATIQSVPAGTATSAADGSYTLTFNVLAETLADSRFWAVLEAGKGGFSSSWATFGPATPATELTSLITLKGPTVTTTFEAEAGGSITDPESGTTVEFPPGAIDATGTVTVEMAVLDPTDPLDLPAAPPLQHEDGPCLETLGAVSIEVKNSADKEVDLVAPAVLTLPETAPAPEPSIPMWYFDEEEGIWVQEGTATVTNGTLVADLPHLSWWGPAVTCEATCHTVCVDGGGAGVTIQATGLDYTGVDTGTTGEDGCACMNVKRDSMVEFVASSLGMESAPVVISTDSAVAECGDTCTDVAELLVLAERDLPCSETDPMTCALGAASGDTSTAELNAINDVCDVMDMFAGEVVYEFTPTVTEQITAEITFTGIDLDLYVLGSLGAYCDLTNCLGISWDPGDSTPESETVTWEAVAGTTYLIGVDGPESGAFDLTLTCGGCPTPDGDGDGFTICDGDCDDTDPALTPVDADGDGVTVCDGDCDDGDPAVNPNAVETCANSIDDNCDGRVDESAGEVSWNDLAGVGVVTTPNAQTIPMTTPSGGTHNVTFSRAQNSTNNAGNAGPFTPPGTANGSFTTTGGPVTGVTVNWTGTQPYLDIYTNVNGVVTYNLGDTAASAFAPGWRWVVGIAGTGGGGGPVTTTSSEPLTLIGTQDAFNSGQYATFNAPDEVVGNVGAVDGYSFFLLPEAATSVDLTISDAGAGNDQHGMIVGALSLATCVP